MPDIKLIIAKLDDYLQKTGKRSIGAVEANDILAKSGLLKDSKSRSGKPFREILRKGLIEHAFQTGGKGSDWVIPLSNNPKYIPSNYSRETAKKVKTTVLKSKSDKSADITELKKHLEKARQNYKPKQVKYLLVAEAPPDNIDRFFYYTDVFEKDDLFLGVTRILYPTLKEKYLESRRRKDGSIKKSILEKLKKDGFFLLDLSEVPISYLTDSLNSQAPLLVSKINAIADKNTKIIDFKQKKKTDP